MFWNADMEEEKYIDFGVDENLAAEPETAYAVNKELNLAWQIIEETGANLFLTGRAGTGKTTFLRKLREKTSKRIVVLAPTGVAAINAQGSTIHSFFQFPFSPYIPDKGFVVNDRKFVPFSTQKKRIISSMSLLVIDEVSMVRPDVLDAIDNILRRFRNRSLPFGGVQLLLIGDLRQLPPVVKTDEWEFLSEHYKSPYFFESHALQAAGFQSVELTTIYRQRDREFISILNKVRDGKADHDVLTRLNARYRKGFLPDDSEGYIRLTTHNNMANSFNTRKLAALSGNSFDFQAKVTGDFPESNFPAEKVLTLKEGAQVMFIKNDLSAEHKYYNGMLGTVVEIDEEKIRIRPLDSEMIIDAEPVEWENSKYSVNEVTKDIDTEVIGTFRQYPLRLAWAITIHKSQGLTFDKTIIDAHASFAAGQTYVALSRCTSLEGLVLNTPIPPSAVIVDRDVDTFISYCDSHSPTPDIMVSLKGEYVRTLLSDMFDFSMLRSAFKDFHRNVVEYLAPLYEGLYDEMKKTMAVVDDEIDAIGRKFISANVSPCGHPFALLSDPAFLERLKRGCDYFYGKLVMVEGCLERMPKEIGNALYAKRLNNTFDALTDQLELKLNLMQKMREKDFSVPVYLNARGVAAIEMQKPRGAINKKKRAVKKKSVKK